MARRSPDVPKRKDLFIRHVPEPTIRHIKGQAGREGAHLGPYLMRVVALVEILQREARKPGPHAAMATGWLREAGFHDL
jgi:hypothetical protein